MLSLLSNNYIGDEGVSFLSKSISKLTNLSTIELNFSYENNFFFEETSMLIDNLQKIRISNNGISVFFESLQTLIFLRILRLYLTGNTITSKGIKHLSKFLPSKLISLDLYLGDNQIKNQGLKYLVTGIKNLCDLDNLELYLGCTGIDERCTNDLLNNISNKYSSLKIYLASNNIIANREKLLNYYKDNVIF